MPNRKHKLTRLPSLPTIAIEILQVFGDPDAPIQRVAEIVQADPAMVSKILKAANSSRFGLAREVADLRQAIALMGKAKITPIVLSFSLASESIEDEEHAAHFQRFWLRSFTQATAGEVLGQRFGPAVASEGFTVNLLAGIGQLALLKNGVEQYMGLVDSATEGETSLDALEQDAYGLTNKELSLEMLETSGLPDRCLEAIGALLPDEEVTPSSEEAVALGKVARVADAFARFLCDSDPGIGMILVQERLKELNVDPELMNDIQTEIREKLAESASLFNIDPSSLPEPEELLEDAMDQLATFTQSMDESRAVPNELLAENGRLKQQVEDLVKQTSTDGLTGIANRAFFDRRLMELTQHCLRRESTMGVVVIDIDRFKSVNDTYGHQAGDHILKQVAQALDGVTRDDETIARYGGEEFCVLLEDAKLEGMTIVGERLRTAVERLPILFESQSIPVTISVGIAMGTPDSKDFGLRLFAEADAALYQAKQTGRNKVVIAAGDLTPGSQVDELQTTD